MAKKEIVIEKYTKKASARILKEVLKVDKKASKLTSLDQAFVILMTHWDMELNIKVSVDGITTCTLCQDWNPGDSPKWEFDASVWDEKHGDWDWSVIYKTILEDIIKKKYYKKPKMTKKLQAQLEEKKKTVEVEKPKEDIKDIEIFSKPQISLEELKRRRGNICAKISNGKKKNKDVSSLEKELKEIKEQIKNYPK